MHRLPPCWCGRSAYQVRPPSTRIGSVKRWNRAIFFPVTYTFSIRPIFSQAIEAKNIFADTRRADPSAFPVFRLLPGSIRELGRRPDLLLLRHVEVGQRAGESLGRKCKSLRQRRMRVDGEADVLGLRAHLHGEGRLGDEVAR